MDPALERLRQTALDRAAASGTLEDMDKAASISKSIAEAEQALDSLASARRQARQQWISAIATVLIPVVSLLALFVAFYFHLQQLRETRQQNNAQLDATRRENEDREWRDLLSSMRGPTETFDSDVTIAPRLSSFFASPRYGGQAKDISIHLMGRLTNATGFKDLYRVVFADLNADSFNKLLDVDRSLGETRNNIETECSNLSHQYKLPDVENYGICTLNTSVNELNKTLGAPLPQRAIQLRQALSAVYANMYLVSGPIVSYLQRNNAVPPLPEQSLSPDLPIPAGESATFPDLTGVSIFNTTLASVDFRNISIDGTEFSHIDFTGADLRAKHYAGVEFITSNWWDAHAIDQNLLDFLIENEFPADIQVASFPPLPPPTPQHYAERITALCHPARPTCAPANLHYK
jgi:hypothetical protein